MTAEQFAIKQLLQHRFSIPGMNLVQFDVWAESFLNDPRGLALNAEQKRYVWGWMANNPQDPSSRIIHVEKASMYARRWLRHWRDRSDAQLSFECSLDADPRDETTRSAYADWLYENEQDQELMEAQRLMIEIGGFPGLFNINPELDPENDLHWQPDGQLLHSFPGLQVNGYRWWTMSSREGVESCVVRELQC